MNESKNAPAGQRGSTNYTPPSKNIIDTLVAAGNFTTLVAGIKTAGLTEKLTGSGPFTVYAPTDEAFKKLAPGALEALLKDSSKLNAVLSYHVVAGHNLAKDVKSGEVMTLQGSHMTTSASTSGVHVNGSHVAQSDIVATNGVVHAIDAVIMPKNWHLLAAAA
jgi:uncharacterized surface protein with fasciclin (FAS1) repeats